MYLDWTTLILLCLAGGIAWFWQDSLAARAVANAAAIEACDRLALQFLDGTVAFARLSFGRGSNGWLILRRTYVFDYTANSIERRQGFIVVSERRVETVGYAQETSHEPSQRPATRASEPAKLVDLAAWRRGERRQEHVGSEDSSQENERSG
jgi:hypothetical protein